MTHNGAQARAIAEIRKTISEPFSADQLHRLADLLNECLPSAERSTALFALCYVAKELANSWSDRAVISQNVEHVQQLMRPLLSRAVELIGQSATTDELYPVIDDAVHQLVEFRAALSTLK